MFFLKGPPTFKRKGVFVFCLEARVKQSLQNEQMLGNLVQNRAINRGFFLFKNPNISKYMWTDWGAPEVLNRLHKSKQRIKELRIEGYGYIKIHKKWMYKIDR